MDIYPKFFKTQYSQWCKSTMSIARDNELMMTAHGDNDSHARHTQGAQQRPLHHPIDRPTAQAPCQRMDANHAKHAHHARQRRQRTIPRQRRRMQRDGKGVWRDGYKAWQCLMAMAAGPAMRRRCDNGAQWQWCDNGMTVQRDDDGATMAYRRSP